MAKFLNTSSANYFLEGIIKDASDRLILISPLPQTKRPHEGVSGG